MGAHHLVDGRLYTVSLPVAPHLPFTYPPLAALVFTPLAVLPRQRRSAGLGRGQRGQPLRRPGAVAARRAPGAGTASGIALWALVLLGPSFLLDPVRLTFYFGQVNLVLCALVLADLTTTPRIGRRTLPRGVLVGVAAAVKLVPLVFVPYLFVTRQARAAWTAVASFAVCSLVALALRPVHLVGVLDPVRHRRLPGGRPVLTTWTRACWVTDRVTHRMVSPTAVDAAGLVVLVAGIALARWAWQDSSPFLGLLVCATTGMVVSPITWQHHLVWAVPVLVWLACAIDRPPLGWLWAAGAGAVLWWSPLERVPSGADRELREHGWTLLAGQLVVRAAGGLPGRRGRAAGRASAGRAPGGRQLPHRPRFPVLQGRRRRGRRARSCTPRRASGTPGTVPRCTRGGRRTNTRGPTGRHRGHPTDRRGRPEAVRVRPRPRTP